MEEKTAETPFDLKARIRRIVTIALASLLVLTLISLYFWSWAGAASCALGGAGVLLFGWVTIAAVAGVANADSKTMRKKITIRLALRFIILLVYLTLLFNAGFLIFEPLVIGMSLLFPTLIIDSAFEFIGKGK